MDHLEFNVALNRVPVRMIGDDDGQGYWICLQELTGRQRAEWINFVSKRQRTDKNGNVSIKDFSGIVPKMLSMGCFTCEAELNPETDEVDIISVGEPVSQTVINDWPNRVQQVLFDKLKTMSKIDPDEDGDNEGND
jgi:hypothetical protein